MANLREVDPSLVPTLVIGASDHPERYSYLALIALQNNGFPAFGLGHHPGTVGKVKISTQPEPLVGIHTITLYVNPRRQPELYDYMIHTLRPRRIIFNPGTENPELIRLCRDNGIEPVIACTLVLLATGQYAESPEDSRASSQEA